MLETTEAMSLRTIMEIVGPIVLAVALIYGTVQWSSRRPVWELAGISPRPRSFLAFGAVHCAARPESPLC